jgi:hypothetical protein
MANVETEFVVIQNAIQKISAEWVYSENALNNTPPASRAAH